MNIVAPQQLLFALYINLEIQVFLIKVIYYHILHVLRGS
jgi:hypothetical protein